MGLFDKLFGETGVDVSEGKAWGNGFNPSVCETCPHRDTSGKLDTCGLCGCPVGEGMPMDRAGAPPESCPYLEEHARDDL